jgi:hypothetical protein
MGFFGGQPSEGSWELIRDLIYERVDLDFLQNYFDIKAQVNYIWEDALE